MRKSEKQNELLQRFPGLIRTGEKLAEYTWFRIGGISDMFCTPRDRYELKSVLTAVKELDIPYVIIGDGSNLLIDDDGFRGIVIRISSGLEPVIENGLLTSEGGLTLSDVLSCAAENNLSGMENLAGIPGTVGGAVFMNAGAYGTSINELLVKAEILTAGFRIETVEPEYFRFRYRWSYLQESGDILLSATFALKEGNRQSIEAEYAGIKQDRAMKHPGEGEFCAGSYFKNLPPEEEGGRRRAAGLYLDRAGAKQFRSGGASVYHKHANMIINRGEATAGDVLRLAEMMKKAAKDKFGIVLEEEVRFLDSENGILYHRS